MWLAATNGFLLAWEIKAAPPQSLLGLQIDNERKTCRPGCLGLDGQYLRDLRRRQADVRVDGWRDAPASRYKPYLHPPTSASRSPSIFRSTVVRALLRLPAPRFRPGGVKESLQNLSRLLARMTSTSSSSRAGGAAGRARRRRSAPAASRCSVPMPRTTSTTTSTS